MSEDSAVSGGGGEKLTTAQKIAATKAQNQARNAESVQIIRGRIADYMRKKTEFEITNTENTVEAAYKRVIDYVYQRVVDGLRELKLVKQEAEKRGGDYSPTREPPPSPEILQSLSDKDWKGVIEKVFDKMPSKGQGGGTRGVRPLSDGSCRSL